MGRSYSEIDILHDLYPTCDDLRAARGRLSESGVHPVLPGGWFAVASKDDSDRLILDRRPRNATEDRLCWARMPHGTLFVSVYPPPRARLTRDR